MKISISVSGDIFSELNDLLIYLLVLILIGLPRWCSDKSSYQWRCGFEPWVREIPWSIKWQPAPVFLPGKHHGKRNLAGNSPWSRIESDMTERLSTHTHTHTHTHSAAHLESTSTGSALDSMLFCYFSYNCPHVYKAMLAPVMKLVIVHVSVHLLPLISRQ